MQHFQWKQIGFWLASLRFDVYQNTEEGQKQPRFCPDSEGVIVFCDLFFIERTKLEREETVAFELIIMSDECLVLLCITTGIRRIIKNTYKIARWGYLGWRLNFNPKNCYCSEGLWRPLKHVDPYWCINLCFQIYIAEFYSWDHCDQKGSAWWLHKAGDRTKQSARSWMAFCCKSILSCYCSP